MWFIMNGHHSCSTRKVFQFYFWLLFEPFDQTPRHEDKTNAAPIKSARPRRLAPEWTQERSTVPDVRHLVIV
jgi:hypothetical protein